MSSLTSVGTGSVVDGVELLGRVAAPEQVIEAPDEVARDRANGDTHQHDGHDPGRHYARHLDFWRHTTATRGSWIVWLALWYSRRRELTCARCGLACANSLTDSLAAVGNMAVGAQLAPELDVAEAVAQWQRHRSEFFVKYRTMYSTHPHTLWRPEAPPNPPSARSIHPLSRPKPVRGRP